MNFPINLSQKITNRIAKGEYRNLKIYPNNSIDFFSNDYLGLANKLHLFKVDSNKIDFKNGSTGSRLISGNSKLFEETESYLANFYQTESALLFANGYMANVGLLSSLPQKEDFILFDEYCHASIRDGIKLSKAEAIAFEHNNYEHLEQKLKTINKNCYVVVESLYSMDGDISNLEILNNICEKYNAYLIVDEAHSTAVYGKYGEGICVEKNLDRIIARVHTFGKGVGNHGAVIVGSKELKEFLVNFCRTFIYTTGLSDFSLLHIKNSHEMVKNANLERENLFAIINYFRAKIILNKYANQFLDSTSPIQAIVGEKIFLKEKESFLIKNNYLVKTIFSPSVPRNKERIRICLHSFNTKIEIDRFFEFLTN